MKKINILNEQHVFGITSKYECIETNDNLCWKNIWLILATWPPDLLPFTNLIELKITEKENMIWYS